MAIQTELEKGQITPAARPIDAFIRPGDENIAQPNQLAQMGSPKGLSFVGGGNNPNVQGYNSFEQLAQALAPFSKNLVEFTQSAGLMYAQGQIADGERRAKEQVLQAMAQNDSAMESEELQRAAMNRALAAKDPRAGEAMSFLNPYAQVGWERGKSKMAGLEAASGLPAFIAKNSQGIDYTAPDQGFGQLAQLQAQYTGQLAQRYGIGAATPGFQKYALPEIEKAQERVQTQHLADRKKYFDTAAVGQASAQLSQLYRTAQSTGQIEYKGQVYTLAGNKQYFWSAMSARAQEIVGATVLNGSLPGEAADRSETIFKSLRALSDYKNDPNFQYFIDNVQGSEVKRDVNGKTVINPITQQPDRLTWGEQFSQASVDSEIKYGQAGFTERKRQREEAVEAPGGLEDRLLQATQGMEMGPERSAIADQTALQFFNEQQAKGIPVSWAEVKRRQKQLLELNTDLRTLGLDPNAASDYFNDLEGRRGSNFNAADERARVTEIAQQLPEKDRAAFSSRALGLIKDREEEQQKFSGYNTTRDGVIRSNVTALLDRNYGPQTDRNKVNRAESDKRMRQGFTTLANQRLLEKEGQLKRRLNDTEVRQVVQTAVDEYGKGAGGGSTATSGSKNQQRDYLFPGSRFGDEPSVRPSDVVRASQPTNPDGTPQKAVPAGKFSEKDLDYLPDRKIVLRNFRDKAILSPQAVDRLIDLAVAGKPMPASVQKAWRDANARNLGEFLLEQADFYPNIELSPEVRQKIQQVSSTQAAAQNYPISQQQSADRTPLLARAGNWALDMLTGSAPAVAATMPTQVQPRPTGGNGSGPGAGPAGGSGGSGPRGGGGGRPSQPQAYPLPASYPAVDGPAPAAPVLPPAPGGTAARTPAAGVTAVEVQPFAGGEQGVVATASPAPFRLIPGPPDRPQATPFVPTPSGGGSFEKPVSVVYERPGGQPGVDLYFPSKRFPAVLGGVVKDVRSEPGYGNYVVVESVDPLTGRKVDVLYAHLADGVTLRPGQRVSAGQVIGKQGGTGNVSSADGTIASVDFFEPRPAGSRDMTPYSGFDPLRRHVVKQLQSTQPAGGGGKGSPDGYLKRLSYLETRIRNIPNDEGSEGRGYFQAFNKFNQEAVAASGGISPRDPDYSRSARATWAWIQKHRPTAADAIKRGDYDTADRILRPTWPSLPGGSQAQKEQVQREARRYLSS